jgi:UDP-glucose 4-epimerase
LVLLEACVQAGIDALVFSSTAAVYGNPETVPVTEDPPTQPLNPYGRSKLMIEQMLADAEAAFGLRHVILRYFNVAGVDPAGRAGLATPNGTHLLKVACEAAVGKRQIVPLFGDDYPTPDGTCVRDFIHVSDLADAHLRAIEHLLARGSSRILNCGYGHGYSVREVRCDGPREWPPTRGRDHAEASWRRNGGRRRYGADPPRTRLAAAL